MGTVALDGGVEQSIVWLFSRIGGGCAVELPEEDIIKRLNGSFAAWKVCDGLFRLREQGVTVSMSRAHNRFSRRCWQINPDCWSQVRLADVTDYCGFD